MRILIHVIGGDASGERGRMRFYSPFAEVLRELGHEVLFYLVQPGSVEHNYGNIFIAPKVQKEKILKLKADLGITWGSHKESDKEFAKLMPRMLFVELGFFDHYRQTCYFDPVGVNASHSLLLQDIENKATQENIKTVKMLQRRYRKDRLIKEPYIFVPLQKEIDTQIRLWSPFNTMNDFLSHVVKLNKDNKKIVYKKHPSAKETNITIENENLIEVTGNVHHYLPYADLIVGINSTALVEGLLYHGNLVAFGGGVCSRNLSDGQRINYLAELYNRQDPWRAHWDVDEIRNTYFYKLLTS